MGRSVRTDETGLAAVFPTAIGAAAGPFRVDEDKAIGRFDESLQRLCVELTCVGWDSYKLSCTPGRFFTAGAKTEADRKKLLLRDGFACLI